jgi:nucleoside-diphosphate-sugar epimerase
MRVLVTGGAGYLGSVLVPKLLARGHQVRVLDIGYFGLGHLRSMRPAVEILRDDVRRASQEPGFSRSLLDGCDAVVHLAAISNDPSADLHPELTRQVNFTATAALAEEARARGIRFVFSSSCSVYGAADGLLDEEAEVRPQTVYAESKVAADRMLGELADARWCPVILRNGTLFGESPRIRFDLVVNIFCLHAVLRRRISVFGDGQQWRPFLHVTDCARAFVQFAESPPDAPGGVYNVAHENLRVVDLVNVFQGLCPGLEVEHVPTDPDRRNYAVSTRRIQGTGFVPRVDVRLGAEGLVDALVSGQIADPESIYYRNAKWLKELSRVDDRHHAATLQLMDTLSALRPPAPPA